MAQHTNSLVGDWANAALTRGVSTTMNGTPYPSPKTGKRSPKTRGVSGLQEISPAAQGRMKMTWVNIA